MEDAPSKGTRATREIEAEGQIVRAIIVSLIWIVIASPASAVDKMFVWTIPCFQPIGDCTDTLSEIPETTIVAQIVRGVSFLNGDTLAFPDIPEIGMKCQMDSALYEIQPATMGALMYRSKDAAGNKSCFYASYVFAIPADSTWRDRYLIPSGPRGLSAQYWDNPDFTGDTVTGIDSLVNFACGSWPMSVAPIPSGTIGPGYFSARWIGNVFTATAGTYSFCIDSDDGARLWIDGVPVMDRWSATGRGESCGSLALASGSHAIKAEYRQSGGSCLVSLTWTKPGGVKAVIPANAFTH